MPVISFGTSESYAHIVYDRENKLCVLVANDAAQLPDAVAVIRSLKADQIWIIAPKGSERFFGSLVEAQEYVLYELYI
jgi:hypothetical protein